MIEQETPLETIIGAWAECQRHIPQLRRERSFKIAVMPRLDMSAALKDGLAPVPADLATSFVEFRVAVTAAGDAYDAFFILTTTGYYKKASHVVSIVEMRRHAMVETLGEERRRRLYDGEPWAKLAREAGFEPYDTEAQARRAFRHCADEIMEFRKAHALMRDFFEHVMPKLNIGASVLDARTITIWNEAERAVSRIERKAP